MILKEFCLASFLVNEINLKHLSPGFKSIHVGLWAQGLFAWGPGGDFVCNASKRDSFPTSLTLSWGQPPPSPPSHPFLDTHHRLPKPRIYQPPPPHLTRALFFHAKPAPFTEPRELLALIKRCPFCKNYNTLDIRLATFF